ncbi:unnamed protein product [Durusdinium trenchii]|uniref:Protein kinase domain-containing protein n=1 Tax=Durusdinium trenchii TaxID=1381693 RepID=A0ABP0NMG1_9DINO
MESAALGAALMAVGPTATATAGAGGLAALALAPCAALVPVALALWAWSQSDDKSRRAATSIRKVWLGYKQRREFLKLREERARAEDDWDMWLMDFKESRHRARFSVGKEVGGGATSTVFEAFMCCGRRVALKVFHRKHTFSFNNEKQALQRVGAHPHIIRLLESFEDPQEDGLVLEFCNRGSLYELYLSCDRYRMEEIIVSKIVSQVVLALQHLVACGIEHRDVKPENILLDDGGDAGDEVPLVKLADFGWASAEPGPIPPSGVGTLWYAPPELNPPVVGVDMRFATGGGKSDMWSVGIITYLLLIGHSPFHLAVEEDEVMLLAAKGQVDTQTEVWNELSFVAKSFMMKLIRPDPVQRLSPSDALEVQFLKTCRPGIGSIGERGQESFFLDRSGGRQLL